MTAAVKYNEIYRISSETDRQRHVKNWLMKSSNHHMTNISPIVTDPNPTMPYQYHHSESIRKLKLRRFHSHDTSSNIFSVADFENARLARRNEIELKKRIQSKMKFNSLDSMGLDDYSTSDSKTSKRSNNKLMKSNADIFLQQISLPKVVKISYNSECEKDMTFSSTSNGNSTSSSSTSTDKINNNNVNICKKGITSKLHKDAAKTNSNDEIVLLYKYVNQRKMYHAYNTKHGTNRKKEFKIPQEFAGYFSLVNDKGMPTATMYTTITQLVRERVYKFYCVDNITAFTESNVANKSGVSGTPFEFSRPHYVKTNACGGQIYRLMAIFEDGKGSEQIKANSMTSFSGREKDKNRYAQLLNENRQVLYVSLSTKGKFYEIEQNGNQMLQRNSISSVRGILSVSQRKINQDCVYKLSTLIPSLSKENSMDLKYIGGHLSDQSVPENLTVFKVTTENMCVICSIPNESLIHQKSSIQPTFLDLKKIKITSHLLFSKCLLGFENEQAMLANHNVQNILKYCQFNCDSFLRTIEIDPIQRPLQRHRSSIENFNILKPLHLSKILRREKSSIIQADEKEDSIIFLSKTDIENISAQHSSSSSRRLSDKMKVFQPSKKKWFKKNEKIASSNNSLNADERIKRMSIDRYCDMSKLLQERFGDIFSNTVNSESLQEPTKKIKKSKSLQDIDFPLKPDLLPEVDSLQVKFRERNDDEKENTVNVQSYISDKMISEFHVKTRDHSKSSLSLNQFLNFRKPSAKDKKTVFKKTVNYESQDTILSANQLLEKEIIEFDDLPYSSVRDSILAENMANDGHGKASYHTQNRHNSIAAPENIYAEIFQETLENREQSTSDEFDEDFEFQDAIDIIEDVSDDDNDSVFAVPNSKNEEEEEEKKDYIGASSDNIYNTLK